MYLTNPQEVLRLGYSKDGDLSQNNALVQEMLQKSKKLKKEETADISQFQLLLKQEVE
jgi:hypothetical protein